MLNIFLNCSGVLVALLGLFGWFALVTWVADSVFKSVLVRLGVWRAFWNFYTEKARAERGE